MAMQNHQVMPASSADPPDAPMESRATSAQREADLKRRMEMEGAVPLSEEEIAQINADYYADMREQRAAAGGAAFANEYMS